MTNRRVFLQGSFSVSLLALSPGLLAALDTLGTANSLQLYKVLFDPRYAESRLFAEAFAERGVAAYGIASGNITPFWRDELSAMWTRSPVPLAGLTDENALFCLEQLGRQYGLRVLQREMQASGLIAWVVAPA